jgi:hypothetical protein
MIRAGVDDGATRDGAELGVWQVLEQLVRQAAAGGA